MERIKVQKIQFFLLFLFEIERKKSSESSEFLVFSF